MISAERLQSLISYNPATGKFLRLYKPRGHGGSDPCVNGPAGYKLLNVVGNKIYAHRAAWAITHGEWPPAGMEVDHINRNKSDNRLANLRLATRAENATNIIRRNRTGLRGVQFDKRRGTWAAQICKDGNRKCLGVFSTPEAASAAYQAAARELHGAFFPALR